MEWQKIFAVLHELIRSTAIAALTLVAAGNKYELGYSVMFVAILFALYGFHAAHYDKMAVNDFGRIANILEDDDGACNGRTIKNPNRLLKALALTRRGRRRRAIVTISSFALLCAFLWSVVVSMWAEGIDIYSWPDELKDEGFYPTLLLIGTLMLGFIVAFDWIYWRETQCVMPLFDAAQGVPFDPQRHGTPRKYSWFGLPSMWFTSKEAYDDLRLWITRAQRLDASGKRRRQSVDSAGLVSKLNPEEMAIFALDAAGGCQLHNALLHAKLYSVQARQFLAREESGASGLRPIAKGEEPEELNLRLIFFDSQSKEYLEPEEEYLQGQVHLLSSVRSQDTFCSEAYPL